VNVAPFGTLRHPSDECALLEPFVAQGKAVFGVEYTGDPAVYCPALNALCYPWLEKDIDLDASRVDCQTFGGR
jgi:hypothetical protein